MGRSLFVGNLPYTCTEAELRALFEPRWRIASIRIVMDRETGRSKGFGFVELHAAEAALEAIAELDGSEVFGRRIAVRQAHERKGALQSPAKRRFEPKKPEISVDTVTRRGGLRRASFRTFAVSDGRRWAAPPEPDELDDRAAMAANEAPSEPQDTTVKRQVRR